MAEIIVALDVPTADEALRLVDTLSGLRWVKVGSVLFLQDGPRLVRDLLARDLKVFLDLKWHDIPNTVAEAVRAAARLGVHRGSVHALGGRDMLRAAARAREEMRLAAVSVLTSHSPESYAEAVGGSGAPDLEAEVHRLSRAAAEAGIDAVVVSPSEAAMVKGLLGPGAWIVVPGIRLPGSPRDDQRRTADPGAAAAAGATHLVVGRPILRAENPGAVYEDLCEAAR
jgi:orotidine-5'-phosphate decarboxylase